MLCFVFFCCVVCCDFFCCVVTFTVVLCVVYFAVVLCLLLLCCVLCVLLLCCVFCCCVVRCVLCFAVVLALPVTVPLCDRTEAFRFSCSFHGARNLRASATCWTTEDSQPELLAMISSHCPLSYLIEELFFLFFIVIILPFLMIFRH